MKSGSVQLVSNQDRQARRRRAGREKELWCLALRVSRVLLDNSVIINRIIVTLQLHIHTVGKTEQSGTKQ